MKKSAEFGKIDQKSKGEVKLDTIVAVATPVGNGGVAVIRMSGEKAVAIASKVFEPWGKNSPKPRHATFGKLSFDDVNDEILALYFPAPHSFTGEDVVEFQIHGGYYLGQTILGKLIELGGRLAERGEFSKRAVLNGKMDLSQAEGIIDIIEATSKTGLRASGNLMRGALKSKVETLQNKLTECLCEIDVALDYPEHDIEYITSQKVGEIAKNLIGEIDNVLATSHVGTQIKNGVRVALAGNPNVGKSSLLNALVGYERAIVTEIAGTTRDTLDASFEFNGVKFNVVDTAGIRTTKDKVEAVGIERAENEIKQADVVLLVVENDQDLLSVDNKNVIVVQNKSDLGKTLQTKPDIIISAKTGQNLEKLKQLIFEKTIDKELLSNELILTNIRHIECLKQAREKLNLVKDSLDDTLDCIAVLISAAWNALGEITGTTANEKILDEIFSRFCLGK